MDEHGHCLTCGHLYCTCDQKEEETETNKVLIWSNEHRGWWRPGQCGYTNYIELAGKYDLEEAIQICNNANKHINYDHAVENDVVPPNETIMPIF